MFGVFQIYSYFDLTWILNSLIIFVWNTSFSFNLKIISLCPETSFASWQFRVSTFSSAATFASYDLTLAISSASFMMLHIILLLSCESNYLL